MTTSEFKKSLADQISPEEAEALRSGSGLYINDFNRAVCSRILDPGKPDDSQVSQEDASLLRADLTDYLNKYMQDRPEGHKWIILACLFLTFVEHLPMHPQYAAKWIERDGKYYCPNMEPGSITCRYCMCEKMTL